MRFERFINSVDKRKHNNTLFACDFCNVRVYSAVLKLSRRIPVQAG
jgi:hypothetical protein